MFWNIFYWKAIVCRLKIDRGFSELRWINFWNRRCLYFVSVLSIWSKAGFKFEWDGSNYQSTRGEIAKSSPRALSSGNGNCAWTFPQTVWTHIQGESLDYLGRYKSHWSKKRIRNDLYNNIKHLRPYFLFKNNIELYQTLLILVHIFNVQHKATNKFDLKWL